MSKTDNMTEDKRLFRMPNTIEWGRWPLPSYEELKKRSKALGGSLDDALALTQPNDPYSAGRPHRARLAEWFAKVWESGEMLGIRPGWHLRRIHYLLVSRPDVVPLPDGEIYTNTLKHWYLLCHAARDAIALSLVPPDILSDARNDAPYISRPSRSRDTAAEIVDGLVAYYPVHRPPRLQLQEQGIRVVIRPEVERPYQVEIWAEKTTVNDVLRPLAHAYGLNIVTASGEISATACRQLVDRTVESGRPVRVLYVSDFDPVGQNIPVAMARKVEYEIDRRQVDLDVQVRPVVLTHAQCIEYHLPRATIKESDLGKSGFEERFGEGATELDALEALRPGELERILRREIRRYWNSDHDDIVDRAFEDFEDEIEAVNNQVTGEFRDELNALNEELQRVTEGVFSELRSKANDLFARMREHLEARQLAFGLPAIEFEADEDPDPLLDSKRDYLEQLAAYKRFQGKSPISLPNGDHKDF
jgi:hypothetical protein